MLPSTIRKITIGWFKQNSGAYALKGITIEENGHSYDSSATFREADAEWLTNVLGAEANIEFPGYYGSSNNLDNYPGWANETKPAARTVREENLEIERAGAALLRSHLERLIQACDTEFISADLAKEISKGREALTLSQAGTQFDVNRAKAVLAQGKKRKW